MKGTRQVQARGLEPHHIGRKFVAFGELAEVRILADGVHIRAADDLRLVVGPQFPLRYYVEAPAGDRDPAGKDRA